MNTRNYYVVCGVVCTSLQSAQELKKESKQTLLLCNQIPKYIMSEPKEITQDIDTAVNIASFDYYTGIQYAKDNNLIQTTSFNDVNAKTHFIVCCGDVMVRVEPTDYPNITRRVF